MVSGPALLPPDRSGGFIELLGGHSAPVTAIAVSDDATVLLSAGLDNMLILWDIRQRRIIRLIHNVGARASIMRLARRNELALVIESVPGVFAIWHLARGECLSTIATDFIDALLISIANVG